VSHWTDRLSDYIDGDLTADERAACEAHLGSCAECRAVLEELRSVIADATRDPEQMPAMDLWPGIATRLEAQTPAPVEELRPRTRRISFSISELALAASLLIAVSAGVAYLLATRPATAPVASEPIVLAVGEPFAATSADARPANFADAAFDAAVSDLERILAEQRDALDPRTVRVLERNLQAIDEAIRQSRLALEADPANPFLNSHLADARQRKLELLRRAALLTEGGD
jgi:anti-sigma-K factor RskA